METRASKWKSFKKFVASDLNSESLYEGSRFFALAGAISATAGIFLNFLLLDISGPIFLVLAAGLFLFLLRWYLQPSLASRADSRHG